MYLSKTKKMIKPDFFEFQPVACAGMHKKISNTLQSMGSKFLSFLDCTKDNETNIHFPGEEKFLPHRKW